MRIVRAAALPPPVSARIAASHSSIEVSARTFIAPAPALLETKTTWFAAVPFASSRRCRATNDQKRVWMSPTGSV